MLTVYGRMTSSNVQTVMWTIAELGLDCERLDYGHVHGGLDTDAFREMNPHRMIPVLQDGDLVIWESCAILRYLAARYGDGGAFWPADPVARARVDMWAEWGKSEFVTDFTRPIFWSVVRTPAKDRDPEALEQALARFQTKLDRLEQHLTGRAHICGAAFTAADIVIGHVLYRWFTIPVTRKPMPALEAYYDRLRDRPAYCDNVMIPYDALRAEGA